MRLDRTVPAAGTGSYANAESIAKRERCSVRQVNMTISLAFLAPDLVKAAIAGRLPHGTSFGVTRIRTESLPLAVSVSGKRDFGAREKCAETTCRL